jgi:signal transduction histidine kinase
VKRAAGLAWSLCGLAVILILAGVVLQIVSPRELLPRRLRPTATEIFDNLTILGLPIIGALIASRHPRNPLGWLFCAAGLGIGLSNFGYNASVYLLLAHPGVLPGGYVLGWISRWAWIFAFGSLPFLLLLFPTGRLHSPRWRPVAVVAAVSSAALLVGAVTAASLLWSLPVFRESEELLSPEAESIGPLVIGSLIAVCVSTLLGLVSVLLRFRASRGEERQQLRLFAVAASVFVVVVVPSTFIGEPDLTLLTAVATLGFFTSIGIAILKYRLYDIDVVISKTLVVGALVVFITAVYLAIVVGIGALVGSGSEPNLFLSVVATAIVALAFQPIRNRARHLANRLVFGKRATPYEVLAGFSERMAVSYATEDVLPRMARILAEGTGAEASEVWLRVGGELRRAATWPAGATLGGGGTLAITGEEFPQLTIGDRAYPVRHRGELLGALAVAKPRGEALTPAEDKLLADLAAQAGLVLRNVRLIEELRASRQRLVSAQDQERRKIERNLHDGAQQQLVALAIKLRLLGSAVEREPVKVKEMAESLQTDAQDAIETLRDLARGIYPPLLADQGLGAALSAQARKSPVPVEIETDGIGRYPQEAEAAVYFCVLEALQNVAKYGEASRATVRLLEDAGRLRFRVEDDGRGFDPAATGYGTGLQGMADRLDALGGSLRVRSAAGEGTVIDGEVPAR